MPNIWNNKNSKELLKAFLALKKESEARRFLRDLLTADEIEEFSSRWLAARLLSYKVPYTIIQSQTGLSSTTIARISQWLNRGLGGYKLMIERLHHHNSLPLHHKGAGQALGKGLR